MHLLGKVQRTVLRGAPIFDGQSHAEQPTGQLLLHRDTALGRF
jgi:hypothetical protein